MIYTAHSIYDPDDIHARPVDSLLSPALNRGGYDADNFEMDSRTMLAGSLVSTDAAFVQGCLTTCIEPDSFSPSGRVVVLSSGAFVRWQAIRAAFIASAGTPAPLANIITR